MPLDFKEYHSLPEIRERWDVNEGDLLYLVANGLLRLSVHVFELAVERGHCEATADGDRLAVATEETWICGLVNLLEQDAFRCLRKGNATIRDLHLPPPRYCRLQQPTPSLTIEQDDLVVRRTVRDAVERTFRLGPKTGTPTSARIVISDGCRTIRAGDQVFRLGRLQARIVAELLQAANAGMPWRDGKTLLQAAGARSAKVSDVFKSQPGWRQLIASDGRGHYRLATE